MPWITSFWKVSVISNSLFESSLWLIVHKLYLKTWTYYLASWSGVQGSLVDEGLGFGRGDGLEATVYKRALAQNSFPEIDDEIGQTMIKLAKLQESLSG